ncbi:long-chain fatty acid--CoA ligase [Agromyces mediolanus]|uniref:AMP-binding enzyme n=1 Tax=Agromyces mediolanus TaxID=41986 RepID=UPI00203F31D3|nr:long-chain fatty acid--CoA ligase [Agromyces mediolanus]MCM3656292.1 long-chain fatty acid--CoA ligase [Agromyces mediolanus]
MSGWLGGPDDRVALALGGRTLDYRALGRAVTALDLPADGAPLLVPVGTHPVDAIVSVLAGLERGRPVLVGTDTRPDEPLPSATELALTTSGSSGAAGRPRIVARTAASWLASSAPLAEASGAARGAVVLITGPMHVSMHLYAALHALHLGGTASDEPTAASVVHATPTKLARLLDRTAVPATAVVAGAAPGDGLRARAAERGVRLVQYYGAAELSFVLIGDGAGMHAFPGVEVELRPAAAGRELWARSPYLALDVLGGGMLRRDASGFATVGDLAEPVARGDRSEAPRLRVLGRGDAAVTVAGETVLAEDVERRLVELAGVRAAVVLGEPDGLLGQRLVAVVELAEGADPAPALARARDLPAAWRPRRWHHAASLPLTDSGKPARGAVADALGSGVYPRIDLPERGA